MARKRSRVTHEHVAPPVHSSARASERCMHQARAAFQQHSARDLVHAHLWCVLVKWCTHDNHYIVVVIEIKNSNTFTTLDDWNAVYCAFARLWADFSIQVDSSVRRAD